MQQHRGVLATVEAERHALGPARRRRVRSESLSGGAVIWDAIQTRSGRRRSPIQVERALYDPHSAVNFLVQLRVAGSGHRLQHLHRGRSLSQRSSCAVRAVELRGSAYMCIRHRSIAWACQRAKTTLPNRKENRIFAKLRFMFCVPQSITLPAAPPVPVTPRLLLAGRTEQAVMAFLRRGAAAAALLLVCAALGAAAGPMRGVDPDVASQYEPVNGKFRCLDDGKAIPFSQVNDGYCDCLDGTDEPGELDGFGSLGALKSCTRSGRLRPPAPAAPAVTLQAPRPARTASSTARTPGSSRSSSTPHLWTTGCAVSVEIQPAPHHRQITAAPARSPPLHARADCCDGTDEPEGTCANTCKAKGSEALAGLREELADARAGLAERRKYTKYGTARAAAADADVGALLPHSALGLASFSGMTVAAVAALVFCAGRRRRLVRSGRLASRRLLAPRGRPSSGSSARQRGGIS